MSIGIHYKRKKKLRAWHVLVIIITCVVALAVFSPSCTRIDLYEPDTGVYLKLELRLQASVGEEVLDRNVETVKILFYSPTHVLVAEDYLPADGGFINVPAGTYDMVVYSLGTEVTRVDGTDTRAGGYAFTSRTGSKVRLSSETKSIDEFDVIYEPDPIYVARLSDVVIPVHSAQDKTIILEGVLEPLLDTYTFEVKHIEGAERIQRADVYITGQAPSKYLWDGRFTNRQCAIYFQGSLDAEKEHLYTVFNTFGKLADARSDVYLNVQLTDTGGSRYQWVYDVTDQFDNPDNTGHHIVIDDQIVIPEPGTGGFNPNVHDWDIEIININL